MTASAEDIRPRGFDSYPVALGDLLRGERATVGKSFADIQHDLKIAEKYIEAIEEGDLSVFETRGFIAGYVRSYARYLNLDGDEAYKQFCEETGFDSKKTDIAHRETPSQNRNQRELIALPNMGSNEATLLARAPLALREQIWYEKISFSAIGSLMVLLLLVSGLSYGGWRVIQEVQRVQFAPVNETPGVASSISVLSDGSSETDITPSVDQTTSIDVATTPVLSLDQLYRPQALDVPSVIPRDGPIATIDPATQGTFLPRNNPVVPVRIEQEHPVAVVENIAPSVDIVATRPAWVRVYLPDNSVLFEKILNVGERYRLPVELQGPLLKAGNSGAVYLMIGDKTYGPVGDNGAVARKISLTEADITETYQEVTDLFSEPLAPPLNVDSKLTAEVILESVKND